MSKRLLASTTLIGVALLLSSTACVDPLGALGAYSDLLSSSEEIRAWQNYDAQVAQAQEEFENGPSVAVRVVNNTPAAARVVLTSAMEAPPLPDMDMFYGDVGYPPITVTESVVVAPRRRRYRSCQMRRRNRSVRSGAVGWRAFLCK